MTNNQQVLKFVNDSIALCQPRNVVWITGEEAQLEELGIAVTDEGDEH